MERTQPKNYLIESILVTLFCCLPFGIVGIFYASQVNSKFVIGDYDGAQAASENAKKWMIWSAVSGVVIVVLFMLLMALGGLALLGLNW